MSLRYQFAPIADPTVTNPPWPLTGLSPTWKFLIRTDDGYDLSANAPTINEHDSISGVYYFDIDYNNIGGVVATHVTGLIDWGSSLGATKQYQEFKGSSTDYATWLSGYPITVTVYEQGTTTPITQHAVITLYDENNENALSPALSVNENGQVFFAAYDGTYSLVPTSTPYVTWENLPWTITVNGSPLSVSVYGTVWEPSAPSISDACVLYILAGDIGGIAVDEGTFEITKIYSPTTVGSGSSTQRVVLTDNPVNLDSGRAEIQVLRGAVVETKFTPGRGTPIIKKVTIPDQDSANWNLL